MLIAFGIDTHTYFILLCVFKKEFITILFIIFKIEFREKKIRKTGFSSLKSVFTKYGSNFILCWSIIAHWFYKSLELYFVFKD